MQHEKEHACKWKEDESKWMHIGMKMKGIWKVMNTNERKMKGTWKEMNAKWKEYACKWKEHEGRCMQMNAKWKEHEVMPKHLKPTKQFVDWISNMLISTKPWKAIGPPKSDNHNNSNYSDVKDFDGSSYIYTYIYTYIYIYIYIYIHIYIYIYVLCINISISIHVSFKHWVFTIHFRSQFDTIPAARTGRKNLQQPTAQSLADCWSLALSQRYGWTMGSHRNRGQTCQNKGQISIVRHGFSMSYHQFLPIVYLSHVRIWLIHKYDLYIFLYF